MKSNPKGDNMLPPMNKKQNNQPNNNNKNAAFL